MKADQGIAQFSKISHTFQNCVFCCYNNNNNNNNNNQEDTIKSKGLLL